MTRILSFLGLALLIFLSACSIQTGGSKQHDESDTTAVVKVPVETVSLKHGRIYDALHLNAVISSEAQVEVHALVVGQVARLYVEEGDRVRAGDTLMRLEDAEIILAERRARLDLAKAKDDLVRMEKLAAAKGLSEMDLADARYRAETSKLAWESARLGLERSRVLAPIAGLVSQRNCQLGAQVGSTTPLFSIVDDRDLIAVLNVPERELLRLSVGQPVAISCQAAGETPFKGKIRRIAPVVDTASGTARVTVGIDDPQAHLRVGMYARFEVITDVHESAMLLPKRAILYDGERAAVWVQKDDSLCERVSVNLGFKNEMSVEVLDGTDPSSVVVVVGQSGLRRDSHIIIVRHDGVDIPMPEDEDATDSAKNDGRAGKVDAQ